MKANNTGPTVQRTPFSRPPFGGPHRPALFGMVHVRALPGTPYHELPVTDIVNTAVREAEAYQAAGFTGILLENMHDRPYCKGKVGPEIVAVMTAVCVAVRRQVGPGYPMGLQILAGANHEALAVALAAGLDFIRAEGFVFGHVADEGWIEAGAAQLLRYRRQIGAEHVGIWTDIQKKHSSHAVTADLSLAEWAHGAEFFGADAVIVTGAHTGDPANPDELAEVKRACALPVVIGSGIDAGNAARFTAADAWIVGSSIKQDGDWARPLDPKRMQQLVAAHRALLAPNSTPRSLPDAPASPAKRRQPRR